MIRIILTTLIILSSNTVYSDCVYGAKDKNSFQVLQNNAVLLTGGFGSDILIKTFCFPSNSSQIQVLKGSFCSYDSAVLYIDGEVCDANQVTKID